MNINEAFNVLNIAQSSATQTEIKRAYKTASLKFHPDRNPAGCQIMQAINAAYNFLSQIGLDPVVVNNASDAKYYDFGEELSQVLNELIKLNGLEIEVCGNWVWVGGETRQYKDKIKELGCKWSKNKSMWYYKPSEYKRCFSSNKSIDEIRETYGSRKVSTRYYNIGHAVA